MWLSIFQPGTVLSCRINHVGITKGTRTITISNLIGDFNSVNRGMTCYIGTTLGGRELGRIRAISATAGTLTVAENAVSWVNGWYLTVVSYFEPWAVFPRIVLSNNIPIFYKDYDIAYTNQNQYMDPVVCMGPNHAGFLITGGYSIWYSSSGSFDPTDGAAPTGFAWNFEGGTPSGSLLPDPGWITYSGAGHFLTSLLATTDSGKTLTGHRHVSIYTRPDEGPAFPILKWGVRSFEGSRDQGGYSLRFFLRETADFARVAEGALVVLFTDDWEGGIPGKAASGAENRGSILFNGYVEDDTINLNPETNVLEFNAASITQVMQRLSTYSWALDDTAAPGNWTQMNDMTVDKAVIHFLRTQSTVMEIADYSWTGDTMKMQYADFGRGDLYQCSNGLYASALLGALVADRQGKMWAEMDANLRTTGSSRSTVLGAGFTITRQDWRSALSWTRTQDETLAYLEYGGIYYSGPSSTGSSLAMLGVAPGDVAGYFGGVERTQGLVILDQNAVNVLVGLGYAKANADFPELSIPIAGDYRCFDIAPQSRLLVTMAASENWRGLVWNNKPFIPQAISYQVRAEAQMMLMDVRAREETHGPPGTTLDIPIDPPYDDDDLPHWEIQFPPIMPWPGIFPPITPEPPTTEAVYCLQVSSSKIFRCDDITVASPTWVSVTIPGGSFVGTINQFWLNIYNPLAQAYVVTQYDSGVDATQGPYVYLVSGLMGTTSQWTNVWGATENHNILWPGVTVQRGPMILFQSPSLGYMIGAAEAVDLGQNLRFIYGQVGGWLAVEMDTQTNVGSAGGNLGHIGGTTIIGAPYAYVCRSDNLGKTQASWSVKWANGRVATNMTSDGIANVMWCSDYDGTQWKLWHHDAGLLPMANVYTDAVDIRPSYGGFLYHPLMHGAEMWHNYKSLINAGDGTLYMVGEKQGSGGGQQVWFRKNSFLQTAADFVPLYDLTSWKLVGVDVHLIDPLRVVASHFKSANNGHIWYSSNGGISWQDKTGNLAALGYQLQQPSVLKFAIGSAALL